MSFVEDYKESLRIVDRILLNDEIDNETKDSILDAKLHLIKANRNIENIKNLFGRI